MSSFRNIFLACLAGAILTAASLLIKNQSAVTVADGSCIGCGSHQTTTMNRGFPFKYYTFSRTSYGGPVVTPPPDTVEHHHDTKALISDLLFWYVVGYLILVISSVARKRVRP